MPNGQWKFGPTTSRDLRSAGSAGINFLPTGKLRLLASTAIIRSGVLTTTLTAFESSRGFPHKVSIISLVWKIRGIPVQKVGQQYK